MTTESKTLTPEQALEAGYTHFLESDEEGSTAYPMNDLHEVLKDSMVRLDDGELVYSQPLAAKLDPNAFSMSADDALVYAYEQVMENMPEVYEHSIWDVVKGHKAELEALFGQINNAVNDKYRVYLGGPELDVAEIVEAIKVEIEAEEAEDPAHA